MQRIAEDVLIIDHTDCKTNDHIQTHHVFENENEGELLESSGSRSPSLSECMLGLCAQECL